MWPRIFVLLNLLLLLLSSPTSAVELSGYEFVVVGAGAGGGPLAARLAMAGHRTLLLDAGDDQGANVNYTVPAYSAKSSEDSAKSSEDSAKSSEDSAKSSEDSAKSSEDSAMAWNFFVRHYADDARQARDFKTSYETPDGRIYTGLSPPAGARMLGTLYPRAATLGGCTAHNALVAVYPHRSNFDDLARITGDDSWSAARMRPYFARLEHNRHLLPGARGHGFDGWLSTETAPLTLALTDPQLLSLILGGTFALGNLTGAVINLASVLAGDANADSARRDRNGGYFQTPLSSRHGQRVGAREFIVAVRDARNPDGSKRYPLDVRTHCHVTKVIVDESGREPRATGVEFLDGAYLYRASPRSRTAARGVPGSATASREIIVAGGTYNSPQILKLSGIGPADELARLGIRVVKDLPGVGANLQDHYEVAVQGRLPANLPTFRGCTFGPAAADDPCLRKWEHPLPLIGSRGPYASNGLPVSMLFKSSVASEYDTFVFGGPVNFRGYYPGYGVDITARKDVFTWAILKSHPRNRAGSVTLQSADPLDVPRITYNFFDTGSGDAAADVRALREGVGLARSAFRRQLVPVAEVLPGEAIQSDQDIDAYVRDTAWGHHASSTCPIGSNDDPMAVLDSSFRVRGVAGLRVVDASVFPRIPGTFTAVSTYMVGEKAADVILQQMERA